MNASCSLITHRIEILPRKRLRLYEFPGRDPSLLKFRPDLAEITLDAVKTDDGWLIAFGYGGLPIRKIPGFFSIEEAFGNEVVDIYKKTAAGEFVLVNDVGEI